MESKTQTCRNCGGNEFYSQDVSLTGIPGSFLPVGSVFTSRDVHLRVCGGCGLLDWFIKPSTLGKVKQRFSGGL